MQNELHSRLSRFQDLLQQYEFDVALVGPSTDFRYLTGQVAHTSERFLALVVPAEGRPTLILPQLEAVRFSLPFEIDLHAWHDGTNPIQLAVDILQHHRVRSIGLNDEFWAAFLIPLYQALPHCRFGLASPLLSQLRMIKSPAELTLLRQAALRVDTAWTRFCHEEHLIGHTERQVARQLSALLLEEALDEVAFCIVASGPNAASPHHEPSDRVIQRGDPVILDFGGPYQGYHADITRTVIAGSLQDSDFAVAYEAVLEAQQAALTAMRPGVSCAEVDKLAREILAQHNLAEAFLHRLGHGLGLSVHEPPYLVSGDTTRLQEGMVVTVEPGIYLTARWGIRVEDVVLVTETGAERLTTSTHDLLELP